MANIYKISMIFTFEPNDQWNVAAPGRGGGWSENLWFTTLPPTGALNTWFTRRMALATQDIFQAGYRITPYTYTGNKLFPQKAVATSTYLQGSFPRDYTNTPNTALLIRCANLSGLSVFNHYIHALPDTVVVSGTLQQNATFGPALTAYLNFLTSTGLHFNGPVCFGRDPGQQSVRLLNWNVVGGTFLANALIPGVIPGVSFVRLRRVYDDNGLPIKGTFFIVAQTPNANGTVTYNYQGPNIQIRSSPSGTVRNDLLAASSVFSASVDEVVEKKVGRPLKLYRGRRSKVRA